MPRHVSSRLQLPPSQTPQCLRMPIYQEIPGQQWGKIELEENMAVKSEEENQMTTLEMILKPHLNSFPHFLVARQAFIVTRPFKHQVLQPQLESEFQKDVKSRFSKRHKGINNGSMTDGMVEKHP